MKRNGSPKSRGSPRKDAGGCELPDFHVGIEELAPGTMCRYHHTRQRMTKMKMNGIKRGGPLSMMMAGSGCGNDVEKFTAWILMGQEWV